MPMLSIGAYEDHEKEIDLSRYEVLDRIPDSNTDGRMLVLQDTKTNEIIMLYSGTVSGRYMRTSWPVAAEGQVWFFAPATEKYVRRAHENEWSYGFGGDSMGSIISGRNNETYGGNLYVTSATGRGPLMENSTYRKAQAFTTKNTDSIYSGYPALMLPLPIFIVGAVTEKDPDERHPTLYSPQGVRIEVKTPNDLLPGLTGDLSKSKPNLDIHFIGTPQDAEKKYNEKMINDSSLPLYIRMVYKLKDTGQGFLRGGFEHTGQDVKLNNKDYKNSPDLLSYDYYLRNFPGWTKNLKEEEKFVRNLVDDPVGTINTNFVQPTVTKVSVEVNNKLIATQKEIQQIGLSRVATVDRNENADSSSNSFIGDKGSLTDLEKGSLKIERAQIFSSLGNAFVDGVQNFPASHMNNQQSRINQEGGDGNAEDTSLTLAHNGVETPFKGAGQGWGTSGYTKAYELSDGTYRLGDQILPADSPALKDKEIVPRLSYLPGGRNYTPFVKPSSGGTGNQMESNATTTIEYDYNPVDDRGLNYGQSLQNDTDDLVLDRGSKKTKEEANDTSFFK